MTGVQGIGGMFIYSNDAVKLADGRGFILNLRVANLSTALEQLRAHGVEIEPKILEWAHGKHAWIRDGDGNRVELYEEII